MKELEAKEKSVVSRLRRNRLENRQMHAIYPRNSTQYPVDLFTQFSLTTTCY